MDEYDLTIIVGHKVAVISEQIMPKTKTITLIRLPVTPLYEHIVRDLCDK